MRSSSAVRLAAVVPAVVAVAQALASAALAADPSPTAAAGGDPRSSGQGPGLVGDPLWAIAIVVVIGVTTLVVTLAYVRTTRGRGDAQGR